MRARTQRIAYRCTRTKSPGPRMAKDLRLFKKLVRIDPTRMIDLVLEVSMQTEGDVEFPP